MKKLLISLLILSLSCFGGQLSINYNNGTPTIIDFSDISNMEIVQESTSMLLVEGGTFQMGSTSIVPSNPVHSVTLSSFYIGKYEVTQTEWIATMGSNPSYYSSDLNRPVEKVNWYDAIVYCNTRSIAEHLTPCYSIVGSAGASTDPATWGDIPSGSNTTWDAATCDFSAKGYRLPTEAEWEFAARGGNSSAGYLYSGSNTGNDVAWYNTNSGSTTHPVGEKAPNELGLFDMSGNVFEWIWDLYGTYSPSAQTNPTGVANSDYRTIRGGTYDCSVGYCRAAMRTYDYAASRWNDMGIRLVRSL